MRVPPAAMPKNFLFDMDGTLVDSAPDVLNAFDKAFEIAAGISGLRIDNRYIGLPVREIILKVMPGAAPEQVEVINREFRRLYDSSGFSASVLYEGVGEALKALSSRGNSLFLVTNKPVKPAREILRKFGLECFDEVVCPDVCEGKVMSKAEMISFLVQEKALRPELTVMVGDTELDIAAAKSAGIRSAAALYGYGDREKILALAPDYLLNKISDLLSLNI